MAERLCLPAPSSGQADFSGEHLREAHQDTTQQAAVELASVRAELAKAITRAERAEAKVEEIEHRATDLRAELDHAHLDAERLRTELAERGLAQQTAAEARERAAGLAGQLEAIQQQSEALLARLTSVEPKPVRGKKAE